MNLLDDYVNEGSTAIIKAAIKDSKGNSITPVSLSWTLTNKDGDIINAREDVAVGSLSSEVSIVLSGDDLLVDSLSECEVRVERVLVLKGTYNSVYGNGLPIKEEARFFIHNLENT